MKTIDIIIPIYFAPDLTIRCAESVIRTTRNLDYDIKVILVDDSDSDDFHKLLKNSFEKKGILNDLILIKREQNGGFIEACYTGIEFREADYKILLNSDTIVIGNWLTEMVKTAESDQKIALVNPMTNNTPVINIDMPEGFNIHLMDSYFRNNSFSNSDYIDVVTVVGFCLLIKNEYIKKYGFFDRVFDKGYGEESDLHFRYVYQGLRAVISPKSFVYHRGEASFSDRDERVMKNRKIFLDRHRKVYEQSFPEFDRQTILHEMRRDINRPIPLIYDVVILSKNNDFLSPSSYFAHKLANIFNEVGISAIVALEKKYDRANQIEDKLYNSILIENLNSREFETKLIISDPELLAESIRLQYLSKSLPEIKLLENFTTSVNFDGKIQKLLASLNIDTVSSINKSASNIVPFAGSLENLGVLIKKEKISKSEKIKSAIIISDNKDDLENPYYPELFNNKITRIYSGEELSKNQKYINSFKLSDNDLLKLFQTHNYFIELRKKIYFSEVHLNFILSGGFIVSDTLLLPSNLPEYIKDRIIVASEISTSQVDSNIEELVNLSDRQLIQDYKLDLSKKTIFDVDYYKNIMNIFFSLERRQYSKNIVYKVLVAGPPGSTNRIRYRVIDKFINLFNRIPYFYSFLKFIVKVLKKIKSKIKL
jgi:GT2 family glycosyltransferase